MFSFAASMKSARQLGEVAVGQLARRGRSRRGRSCSGESTRMFAGCGSPWKKPWRKIIVSHVSAMTYARRRRCSIVQCVGLEVGELDALEVLERQHALARVAPVDARHDDVRVPGEVAVERLGVAGLLAVVELLADRARELVDDLAGVDEVERTDALLDEPRGLLEQLDVALDLARRVRPLHLHGDLRPFGSTARCTWPIDAAAIGCSSNSTKRRPIGCCRSSSDDPLDVGERERRDVVLEAAELGDDVRRDDVRARREELPELDERRPELVEHLAQMAPADRVDVSAAARAGLRAANPKPWRTATWAISPSRPMLAVFDFDAMLGVASCCTRPLARERCRHAPVDREHRAGRRPRAVGDEERDRLGDVGAGDRAAEQAPRRIERLDLLERDAVRLGALARGARPTRASSRRRSRRG